MSNTPNTNKPTSNDSGIVRTVPIILVAAAIFIAVCFIFGGTGAFGHGISSVFLGLFAGGAYIIPLLLALHALFFKEDYEKKNLVSRIVFSLIALLIFASFDYTIRFWGTEPVFDPALFYDKQIAGGFIGGIFSFCVTKIIGAVGLIIVDITAIVIYAIVFFGRKDSTARRGVLGVLEVFASLLAAIEDKIKKNAERRREEKAEEKRQETERHHAEFLDDQFFESDGNMDELEIRKLGIHETRDPKTAEKRPNLHNKVFNKSALSKEELEKERTERERREKATQKRSGFDFNVTASATSKKTASSDMGSVFFEHSDVKFGAQHSAFDTRENASEVFTKDFDPFDFATGEKLIAKQSTKAVTASKKQTAADDETSLFYVTEESIAAMHRRQADIRRREEFEAKKAKIFGRPAPAPKVEESVTVAADTKAEGAAAEAPKPEVQAAPAGPEKTPVSPKIHIPGFSVAASAPVTAVNEPTSILKPVITETITTEATFGTPPEITDMEYVQVTEDIEAIIADTSNDDEIKKIAESAAWGRPAHVEEEAAEIVEEEDPIISLGNPEEKDFDTVAEEIAELVRRNNPAYARSANKSIFTTTVRESGGDVIEENTASPSSRESTAEKAEEHSELAKSVPFVIEDVSYDTDEKSNDTSAASELTITDFKPYTPPTLEEAVPEKAEPVLVTERELITPKRETFTNGVLGQEPTDSATAFSTEKAETVKSELPKETPTIDDALFSSADAPAPIFTAESEETSGTVFNFGEDDTEDGEITISEAEEYAEEPSENISPIPPEEQNPDVIKQRAMFPFLDEKDDISEAESLSKSADISKNEIKTEAELPKETSSPITDSKAASQKDEKPPFDIEEKSETAIVPAEEKPKKKDYSDFVLPPIDLLHPVNDERASDDVAAEIQDNADKLIDTLASFGVTASIKGVDRGPRITRYEVVPARGTKVSSIMNLDNDIALNLAADGIRMEAPIPGKTAVGVEIPNKKASLVRLRELIETADYRDLKSKTTVCMGKDVAGQPIFADVAKMPHALVAGATGMGKSVWINSLMLSILYKARPDEVKFIMIDPKQVEFTMYNGIPHLLVPVVTDVKQAAGTLMWAVEEMERRYGVLQELCVRNIDAYNDKVSASPALGEPMSRIIIVIDEFAELIMQAKNPVESLIIRIAQKARAAGIHLIIGTQKPVKEVITGLIKSNIPSKFSCKVASNRDSILIFDAAGAEKLLDKGDMLVSFANSIKPLRVQSAFVADDEVETVMEYLKSFSDGSNYDESVMEEIKRAADKCSKKGGSDRDDDDDDEGSYGDGYLNDKQFLSAVEIAVNTGKISTSLIQRKISIGYGKAAKFLDVMEDMGIVGESNGSKPREVLISADEWREKLARTSYD